MYVAQASTGYDDTHDYADIDYGWEAIDSLKYDCLPELSQALRDSNLPDMSFEAGFRMCGWSANSPINSTLEWFSFDFEFGDVPGATGLKNGIPVC